MIVDVVQFLMPDGRQKEITTELPDECEGLYRNMLECGCRFEAEVLTTGEVSVTISDDEGDVDIVLSKNCPDVQGGMAAMLQRQLWLNPKEGL